ncbi:hypothetical protein NT6N_32300 [Oceaniferula spumae]|uniref:Uncharacterized protein n=1 Tax=Oceaniferula spumae TaxID=2979115 RepID=A0AAT9FQA5_9BACT
MKTSGLNDKVKDRESLVKCAKYPRAAAIGGLVLVVLSAFGMFYSNQFPGTSLNVLAPITFISGIVICLKAQVISPMAREITRLQERIKQLENRGADI